MKKSRNAGVQNNYTDSFATHVKECRERFSKSALEIKKMYAQLPSNMGDSTINSSMNRQKTPNELPSSRVNNAGNRLYQHAVDAKVRRQRLVEEKEKKDVESLQQIPVVNQKYKRRVTLKNPHEVLTRFQTEQQIKDAKIARLKEKWGPDPKLIEEEKALAIRDAKSGRKECAETIVAR